MENKLDDAGNNHEPISSKDKSRFRKLLSDHVGVKLSLIVLEERTTI